MHYCDVIMGAMGSQITSLTIVYSTVHSGADQGKHESSASLAFKRGLHRWQMNSPRKWPVTRKMFPFNDVIMALPSVLHYCVEHVIISGHLLTAPNCMHIPYIYGILIAWDCGNFLFAACSISRFSRNTVYSRNIVYNVDNWIWIRAYCMLVRKMSLWGSFNLIYFRLKFYRW